MAAAPPSAGAADRQVLDLAQALIRVPSPNPPGEERPVAEFLARYLRERGVEAEVHPVGAPDAPQANVFARVPGRGRRPALVLCGHLDTVPAGEGAWLRDPYAPVVAGGRLYGLGAADMKGAVAAMTVAAICVAAQSKERPLAGDLVLAFTSGEETGSFGARAFAHSGLLDGAAGIVIGEPTENRIGIAEKGGMWLELALHGRTAHGSLPHLGANAVSGLAEALARVEQALGPNGDARATADATGSAVRAAMDWRLGQPMGVEPTLDAAGGALRAAMGWPPHPLLGAPTLTPTRLAGGVANNVVPDRASATLDVRTVPGQSHPDIRAALQRLLVEVAAARGLRGELLVLGDRAALDVPPDLPFVQSCLAVATEALGRQAETCGLTGATDATELIPALGLPFVICGPGEMAQAHQPDESVSLDHLAAATRLYRRLAQAWCA